MIHTRNGDYGVIMGDAGGPPHFLVDPVFRRETGTGIATLVGGPNNLAGGGAPYEDMSPGYSAGHDLGQSWSYELEWVSFGAPLTTFFQASDHSGTPTSTSRPAYAQAFALCALYAGPPASSPPAGMAFYLARTDGTHIYDDTLHTITAPAETTQETIVGNQLSSDAFWDDLLTGAHPLRFLVDATGPGDSFWRLYAFGLRYPVIPSTHEPLRQVGRPDKARQYPRHHIDGSRQVGHIP